MATIRQMGISHKLSGRGVRWERLIDGHRYVSSPANC